MNEIEEKKLKHLEFIQNIITRMNANSFAIKGWAVTFISAILIFADKQNDKTYLLIPVMATILFWALDIYYLSMEKQYRKLFQEVCQKKVEEEAKAIEDKAYHFDLDASKYTGTVFEAFTSPSIFLIYVALMAMIVVMWFVIK